MTAVIRKHPADVVSDFQKCRLTGVPSKQHHSFSSFGTKKQHQGGQLEKTEDASQGPRPACDDGQDNLKNTCVSILGRWGLEGHNKRRCTLTIGAEVIHQNDLLDQVGRSSVQDTEAVKGREKPRFRGHLLFTPPCCGAPPPPSSGASMLAMGSCLQTFGP